MSATPQQVAAAQAVAKSRGYDPSLVDADNADRVNTAFPVQQKPAAAPATAAPAPVTAAPHPVTATPNPATAAPAPTGGAGGADISGVGSALAGLQTAVDSPAPSGAGPSPAATGLAGATPDLGMGGGGGAQAFSPSALRQGLGQRSYPQESYTIAGLRRAY